LNPFDNGPCDIVEGDKFFLYKASEYAGSFRAWDDFVATILRDLPLNPRMGRMVPGFLDYYALPILSELPLLLLYRVEDRNGECFVILLDLVVVGP
jgi:hypothetical protein